MRLGFVGGQPHRTAPHALRAERHRRRHLASAPDATRTEHGDVDGIDDLGDQHHRADLTGVATRLRPLGDDDVDPCGLMTLGVLRTPGERTDQPPLLLDAVDQELRRRPECVGDEGGPVSERDLQLGPGRGCAERSDTTVSTGRAATRPLLVRRELRHVVATQDVVDELAVGVGDQGSDVVERIAATLVAGVLGGHDQVDAVGTLADLVLDPRQVDLELLGRVGDGAEHTESTCLRHGGDDIAAVAEGEDRELDVEHLGGGGLHRGLLTAGLTSTL